MEKSLIFATAFVRFIYLDTVNCFPIDISSVGEGGSNPLWLTNYVLTGFGFLLILISIVFGCVCCRNGKGFKEFSNSSGNLAVSRLDGFVNPTLNSELTIFPPLGASTNEICRFEPLPDIKYQAQNLRPAAFSYTEQEISSQDWFVDPQKNFPRNQLKYVQEYGRGWFGRVVEGEAQNITPEEKVTKVMVKILHEDATPTDHMYFLHEVKFYRDLKHPNILRLLGQCLEMEPFLIMLEYYPNGDLKSFLSQNLASAQALVEQGVTLKMCSNITSGLEFMHEKKFIHTDLAARNCLVGPDLSVKIGDYGNSIEIFRSDYYCAGSVALPVRWCAPETLKCTDITIETREVTPPANIWSLGVVFWEICEFCKLPYAELNDDQVIVRVLGEKNYFLEKPNMFCLHKDELYHLMKLCWKPPLQRPSASQIHVILNNLISSGKMNQSEVEMDSNRISQDFEQRWQNLKPNSIPKKDNAVEVENNTPVDCSIMPLKLKNSKVADSSLIDSPLGVFMASKSSGEESPRVCLKFEKEAVAKNRMKRLEEAFEGGKEVEGSVKERSVSGQGDAEGSVCKAEFDCSSEVQTVNGDVKFKGTEPEVDSWLKGVEINNEEDESFVRKISEAIRDLDATLAMERTSSSEENSGKSSRQNSPGKDVKEGSEVTVDFKLGQDTSSFMNFTQKTFELSSLQNTEQPQSLNFTDDYSEKSKDLCDNYGSASLMMPFMGVSKCKSDPLDESLKENDSMLCGQSRNSSDTDDEIWRRRIERGEISEKVKEKSKSIANLMILTHIDSDDSDIDLEKPSDKCTSLHRSSFARRSGSFAKSSLSSNNFGSENDLTFAVLEEEFKESLKKLSNDHKEHGRFDSLGVILPSSANRENVWENLFKPSETEGEATLPQTDVNRTREDSDGAVGRLPAAVLPGEGKQITHTGSNFLANAASEPLVEKKEPREDWRDERSASSREEPEGRSSDPSAPKESCSQCDSETNCSDSLLDSSHLRESCGAASGAVASGVVEDSNWRNVRNPEGRESIVDEEEGEEGGNGGSPRGGEGKSGVRGGEAEGKLQSGTKGGSGVPEITVSEEAEENLGEKEKEEIFVMEAPVPKRFKFVLRDFEVPPLLEGKRTEGENGGHLEGMSRGDSLLGEAGGSKVKKPVDGMGENSVIVGACEDFTMDYFRGLKSGSEEGVFQGFRGGEENLDVWDKHLEKAFSQQLKDANFEEISFRSVWSESGDCQEAKDLGVDGGKGSLGSLAEFIESERVHTERVEEPIHINRLTSLSVMGSEEEYEHFKLRTPDDERSSDSGFRDKGSLSESVEDGCEGKYNLEDIEAELEEAFVKGVFGNNEVEKEKDSSKGSERKNVNNFEYEESKFYEEENKNEEELSDIDGEIEFWQNKDESDYYPEISEFNPTCSQGWYLHPPEENSMSYERNINEDIVNALRNELEESLPVQSRSFDGFNDFYETETEEPAIDLNIHYMSEFSLPLSPILEEQDPPSTVAKRSPRGFEGGGAPNKVKKNVAKLIESAKAIDTNTFMQYLEYMVESEGRDLCELEGGKGDGGGGGGDGGGKEEILVVDVRTNEARLVGGGEEGRSGEGSERRGGEEKGECWDEVTENSDNEGLVFTPEMLSPEREGSLSELSRTGDALSEITLSSPDLVPDCFSGFVQDPFAQREPAEATSKPAQSGKSEKAAHRHSKSENGEDCKPPTDLEPGSQPSEQSERKQDADAFENSLQYSKPKELPKNTKALSNVETALDASDSYEMSTSFMGEEEEDTFSDSSKVGERVGGEEQSPCLVARKELLVEDSDTADWQSETSGDEELSSSSSEEFIWKLYEKGEVDSSGDGGLSEKAKERKEGHEGEAVEKGDENGGDDDDDDDNESSTGSSASFTDFVPSAWNSQATPSRSALKSPDNKKDKQKKSVWFKKQKYHCVYEYPREPSDNEDSDPAPFQLSGFESNLPETQSKHFNYGVNTVELPNKHFPYGISKVIDLSAYTDWDVVEGEDLDLSLTDTDSDNGSGKGDANAKMADYSFYNLSPFDYDFSTSDMPETESEFLVSSSARPFQGGSSVNFPSGLNAEGKAMRNDGRSTKDFVTPDSGIEDSTNVTPQEKVGSSQDKLYLKVNNLSYPNTDIIDILDNFNFSFATDSKEKNSKGKDFEETGNSKNGFSNCNASVAAPLADSELGKLKHARGRLKLDLPRNHNAELGTVMGARKD